MKRYRRRFQFKEKQIELFWYWINERHAIYLKKKAEKPQPWTKDPILHKFKFTNPFRQNDRVTQAWQSRYMRLLARQETIEPGDILFHCVLFRLFNWPATYDEIYFSGATGKAEKGKLRWNKAKALEVVDKMKADGRQIFTGAYIVPNLGLSSPKHELIIDAIDYVYQNRVKLARRLMKKPRMEKAVAILQEINSVGPFIAYEIACDLRFARVLHDARDVLRWANPGPGAKRGIHRLLRGKKDWPGKKPDYVAVMRELLVMSKRHLKKHVKTCEWPFEMREIEHSLCEFDKYMRVKNKEGRPRSLYTPLNLPWETSVSADDVKKPKPFKPMDPPAAVRRVREMREKLEAEGQMDMFKSNVGGKRYIRGEAR